MRVHRILTRCSKRRFGVIGGGIDLAKLKCCCDCEFYREPDNRSLDSFLNGSIQQCAAPEAREYANIITGALPKCVDMRKNCIGYCGKKAAWFKRKRG